MGLDAQRAVWEQYLGHLEQNRDDLQDYDNPGMKLFLDWSMQWAAFQAETQRAFNRLQVEMVKGYLSYLENLGRELERAPSPGSTPPPPDATAPADGAAARGADATAGPRPSTNPPDAAPPPPGTYRPAPDDGAI
jgi:hypothetical protein